MTGGRPRGRDRAGRRARPVAGRARRPATAQPRRAIRATSQLDASRAQADRRGAGRSAPASDRPARARAKAPTGSPASRSQAGSPTLDQSTSSGSTTNARTAAEADRDRHEPDRSPRPPGPPGGPASRPPGPPPAGAARRDPGAEVDRGPPGPGRRGRARRQPVDHPPGQVVEVVAGPGAVEAHPSGLVAAPAAEDRLGDEVAPEVAVEAGGDGRRGPSPRVESTRRSARCPE